VSWAINKPGKVKVNLIRNWPNPTADYVNVNSSKVPTAFLEGTDEKSSEWGFAAVTPKLDLLRSPQQAVPQQNS
jgi:hypothetical protein